MSRFNKMFERKNNEIKNPVDFISDAIRRAEFCNRHFSGQNSL